MSTLNQLLPLSQRDHSAQDSGSNGERQAVAGACCTALGGRWGCSVDGLGLVGCLDGGHSSRQLLLRSEGQDLNGRGCGWMVAAAAGGRQQVVCQQGSTWATVDRQLQLDMLDML